MNIAEQIARKIARDIFEIGDEPRSKTIRIAFKGGEFQNDFDMGGLCEEALVNLIEESVVNALTDTSPEGNQT